MGCTILDCEQLKMLPVILNYVRIAKKKKKVIFCGFCSVIGSRLACVCRVIKGCGRLLNTQVKTLARQVSREH